MSRATARTNTVNAGGGGTVNDGVLQIQGGVFIDGNYRPVTDQLGNESRLWLSSDGVRINSGLGVGTDPSNIYAIVTNGSLGGILTSQIHLGFSASLYMGAYNSNTIGSFAPAGGAFEVNVDGSTGSPNVYFRVNETRSWVRTYLDFGNGAVDANRPAIGPSLTHGSYIQNGEYLRFQSGHNADWVSANYYFNVPTRTFNAAVPTGNVASVIEIPNHTFSITNSGSNLVNYRGLSLAYTINNTVSATGVASGVSIDASITNANGMLHRGFYYRLSGAGVTSNTQHIGIELENSVLATNNNQQLSPYIYFKGNGWKTNATAESQPVAIRIGLLPVQSTSNPRPNFVIEQSTNNGAYTNLLTIGPDNFGNPQAVFAGNITSTGITNTGSVISNATNGASTNSIFSATGTSKSYASGDFSIYASSVGISSTSGPGTLTAFVYNGTINQTGSANGITRGVWINPTLTSAPDFRAYEALFTFAAPASSSHTFRGINLVYTINNGVTQTGTGTGIFLNATETALNGMTHNLMNLQVGGNSMFFVSGTGLTGINTSTGTAQLQVHTRNATTPGLILRASASQSAAMIDVQDSTGVSMFSIGQTGNITNVGSAPIWSFVRVSSDANPPRMEFSKARGTVASPAAVVAGDQTGAYFFNAWGSTNYIRTGMIINQIESNSGTVMKSRILFSLGSGGGTGVSPRVIIGEEGMLLMDIADMNAGPSWTTPISAKLEVRSNSTTRPTIIARNIASQTADQQQWQDDAGTVLSRIFANGGLGLVSMTDASAPNSSLYFSSTVNKLVWKDSSGTVNQLY